MLAWFALGGLVVLVGVVGGRGGGFGGGTDGGGGAGVRGGGSLSGVGVGGGGDAAGGDHEDDGADQPAGKLLLDLQPWQSWPAGRADGGGHLHKDRDGDRKSTRLNSSHVAISYAV